MLNSSISPEVKRQESDILEIDSNLDSDEDDNIQNNPYSSLSTAPKIRIPSHREISHHDPVPSILLTSLLRGLMEVRIPVRLGNLKQYENFMNHPYFVLHQYHLPTMTKTVKSPLFSTFFSGYDVNDLPQSSGIHSEAELNKLAAIPSLSEDLKKKLIKYTYTNPENKFFSSYFRGSSDDCQSKTIISSYTLFSSNLLSNSHEDIN